jgi:uncharacterized protein
VLLRELIAFEDQGADAFFGEPEFDTANLLRCATDGRGIVSLLELPQLQDRPALFSTFLMWLLADLFEELPEVGDIDKPKLVFFFDEAHLLFNDASKDFLAAITQTVRLIRSKGVGVFFVTQTPKDVPADVLAQLGNRVQHALRAFTPDDAKALKATASTFPRSSYDLENVLTQLGIGEAVITVLSERGAPTPVAWTMLRAPQASMSPLDAERINAAVAASPLAPSTANRSTANRRTSDWQRSLHLLRLDHWSRSPSRRLRRRRRTAACSTIPCSRLSPQLLQRRSGARSCAASSARDVAAASDKMGRAPIRR